MTLETFTNGVGRKTWDYRVMRRRDELAVYSVYYYYEAGRVEGYSESPAFPAGETLDELAADCELYALALKKPILQYQE